MNVDVIAAKLELLRYCIARIEDKTPESAGALATDADLQDIITHNLERVVRISVDIASHILAEADVPSPTTMGETFDALARTGIIDADSAERLKNAVGFRNITIHEYEKVDWGIVFSICTERLGDFRTFAASLMKHYGIE